MVKGVGLGVGFTAGNTDETGAGVAFMFPVLFSKLPRSTITTLETTKRVATIYGKNSVKSCFILP